jgi:indoleamine 2,3-dioxygenase
MPLSESLGSIPIRQGRYNLLRQSRAEAIARVPISNLPALGMLRGPAPIPFDETLAMDIDAQYARCGFLPAEDPMTRFGETSEFAPLDELGHDLPSLLVDASFREYAKRVKVPPLPKSDPPQPLLRLYYVRLGFLASAYVNQVGQEPANVLPSNIAVPLCDVCKRLGRPPILSYDGYALYNWKRFNSNGPIALGNIDTIQNFVHLYDEHWFILVHVEIEALAAGLLGGILAAGKAAAAGDVGALNRAMELVVRSVWEQVRVLRRIPEKMDPALYYRTFRPYIRFFESVVYEGVDVAPMAQRGETGAQSSVIPALVEFLKIPHQPTRLTDHLADMRRFMPAEHRAFLERVGALPSVREIADKALYNEALEALATFRETHLGFARDYIARWVDDPRGTGGTPYLEWLGQLIAETRAYKIP